MAADGVQNGMAPFNGNFLGPDGEVHNILEIAGGAGGGSAVTIEVGATTTGQPGTQASVNDSGTDNKVVLDFTIPAGADGGTGPAGAAGPQGPAAPSIKAIVLTKDAGGEITGGTATMSDDTTVPITITTE